MSEALPRIAELVRRETGLVTSETQMPALAAAVARVAQDMDLERFLHELATRDADGALFAALVDEVTINETYFFRELAELRAIDWVQLLREAQACGADAVRVWVSACATGEEAYTLAILASEALGTAQPPVTIVATDISGAATARAEAATYNERSLRNVPAELRERYFTRDADRSVVASPTRACVRFRRHNLLKDPLPPRGEAPFDIVTCRNLLIYFDDHTAARVISSFDAAMRPSGVLILGAADRLSGAARRLGDATPPGPAVERRRSPSPKRSLRRPLGLADRPSPHADTPQRDGAPPAPTPRRRAEDRIEDALDAANAGDLRSALTIIGEVLEAEPLNADAFFVCGLAKLAMGDADGAATALRSALYVDPSFGLAAFQLGRAQDARGEVRAARRAYEQALRTLDRAHDRHSLILEKVDLGDVAAACRARLAALTSQTIAAADPLASRGHRR